MTGNLRFYDNSLTFTGYNAVIRRLTTSFDSLVTFQEGFRIEISEVFKRFAQAFVAPVPPGERLHSRNDIGRKTLADQPRRNTAEIIRVSATVQA